MTSDTEDSPAATARRLIRAVARGALGTVMRETEGQPYVSLVSVASDHDGAPILLLSDLADHSKNLARDDRASLLLDGTGERDDPLTGARLTLQGQLGKGCDLRLDHQTARLPFDRPVDDAESARVELVSLAKQARATPP